MPSSPFCPVLFFYDVAVSPRALIPEFMIEPICQRYHEEPP